MSDKKKFGIKKPPFDTADLRENLKTFFDTPFLHGTLTGSKAIGNFKWGVYAFYDYDGEPIYVGQTNEKLRTRIRRHLTNQRTDAVAMSVLDPFEVYEIEVWPLPEYEEHDKKSAVAKSQLNALEYAVTNKAVQDSRFKAILNEKDPPLPSLEASIPQSFRRKIVSDNVHKLRSHPDVRIARRALIISRLAQVISEREVKVGLRRVLVTQTMRLRWLAEQRFLALGGNEFVERGDIDED